MLGLATPWDRGAVATAATSTVLVALAAVWEAAAGGWGTLTGWTLIGSSAVLAAVALASLVHRRSAPVPARTWTGVWVPLLALAFDVGLVAAVFAAARVLRA